MQRKLSPATQEGLHTEQNKSRPSWVREFLLSITKHIAAHCWDLGGTPAKGYFTLALSFFWFFLRQLPPGFDTGGSTFSLSYPEIPTPHRYLPCNTFRLSLKMMLFRPCELSFHIFRGGGDSCTITSQLRGHNVSYSNQDDLAAFQCLLWPGKVAIPP